MTDEAGFVADGLVHRLLFVYASAVSPWRGAFALA
ncbi:hypothetical protein BJ982_005591 [Sphaerisporangium siamense]|uniref:Uncharacterized protein n=1 Tax=Sphaerisporangium siamense TaxID=795645 RepID=A0A7W7GC02_9ACTN|nr:hypothetical protein [Sphaerisporangium siamense]